MSEAMPSGPRAADVGAASVRGAHVNLAELAYERIEACIVDCTLRPGQALRVQDLQLMTSIGRTPIHQAVNRLAADTLITIRPRHGLLVTPINLPRERNLLALRRDMERFVVRLAAERCDATQQRELLGLIGTLRDQGHAMEIDAFNRLDRRIDILLNAAAGEPFLENTLRPLHTIFRRIGWIYHSLVRPQCGVGQTVDAHLAIIEAVAAQGVEDAMRQSDRLIDFMGAMFDTIEREIDPAALDCARAP